MGGITSKRASTRQASSIGSNSYSWGHQNHPQPPYSQSTQEYWQQQQFAPPPPTYGGGQAPEPRRRLERKYSKIDDNYISLEQVYCIMYAHYF